MDIKFTGLPWQRINRFWANDADGTTGERYGWNPMRVKGMGRFGGGWAFSLGITVSRSMREIVIDFVLGSVRISFVRKKT